MTKYIDADALLSKYGEKHFNGEITSEEYYAIKIPLDYAPTADVVEVKHGEWITWDGGCSCSICGKDSQSGDSTDYCPNCGADLHTNNEVRDLYTLCQEDFEKGERQ